MINRACSYLLIFFVLTMVSACKKTGEATASYGEKGFFTGLFSSKNEIEYMQPADYVSWCEDESNGLKQSKEIGEFKFSAFMKPVDYLVTKDLKNDVTDQKKVAESKKEYEGLTYFSFRIEDTKQQDELLKINLSAESEYYGRLEYFSFKMQQDFKLISGDDTTSCTLYHFERTYGLAPFATFVLGFPANVKNNDVKLWYHDKIFNNGIIMFNFKKELVTNLPKLTI